MSIIIIMPPYVMFFFLPRMGLNDNIATYIHTYRNSDSIPVVMCSVSLKILRNFVLTLTTGRTCNYCLFMSNLVP